jgi:hypothetical protein
VAGIRDIAWRAWVIEAETEAAHLETVNLMRLGRAAVAAALVLLAALAVVAVLEPHWRAAAAQLDAQRPALRTEPAAPAWPAASDHAARVSAC